ncbi:fumarylacetoacetate hydrolase family protein [Actinocorallia sp. API 0066]|uniref:fumarylacetoacetate hydrolase family protein n=1 Tax=Actinocorallia sp. API 0066 TaxID=2896846 RepID=UPI001E562CAF|nr:fumarylacetoacetate hydrolase family protein [Actinocorallia sp. API 0066]MCD0447982.1 fumarylacetoacetate hydrolase family protein [Actinocorallia sp. API 0066]
MRLANVIIKGRPRLAVRGDEDVVVDAALLLGRDDLDMQTVIAHSGSLLPSLRAKLARPAPEHTILDVSVDAPAISSASAAADIPAGSRRVRWLPPSPRPSKIVGVAVNNRLGARFAHRAPVEPAYFLKPPSALTGHREPIVVPAEYGLTHPEPELAAIIGTRSRDLAPDTALDAVFGFTIINDITSPGLKDRDSMELVLPGPIGSDLGWRRRHGEDDHSVYLTYHARSKGCDTFAPMGPWLVTREEVADPNDLDIEGRLNGELVLTDSTRNLTFTIQAALAHLSRHMTLEPGDIVHFGTAFQPAAPDRYPTIRHLDLSTIDGTFSVGISGIGRLDNPIRRS